MTRELSALLDGELETHEAPALWSSVRSDRQLGRTWSEYQLIRDALHKEDRLDADLVANVMNELEAEPTVLAPASGSRQPRRQSMALALAASVAGVVVVGWLALAPQGDFQDAGLLARSPAAKPGLAQVVQVPAGARTSGQTLPGASGTAGGQLAAPDYREYLLAHQTNAAGLYMQGGAQHIRTVSSVGAGQ